MLEELFSARGGGLHHEDLGDAVPGEVTLLLQRFSDGDKAAADHLFPLIYGELRKIATGYARRERPGHTLQATALVHEAYLRLTRQCRTEWKNRTHFYGVAAQVMRRVLVQYARDRNAQKRGAAARVDADLANLAVTMSSQKSEEILAVDLALERLQALDPRQASIIELRYYCGLSVEQTAEALGLSERTVKREWAVARRWLQAQLGVGAAEAVSEDENV